jgi:activator of HSP90 ATPase
MKKLNQVRKTRATKRRLLRNFEADMVSTHSKDEKLAYKSSQAKRGGKKRSSSKKKKVITTKK